MEPIWGRHGPGGPHIGPMNLAIWDANESFYDMYVMLRYIVLYDMTVSPDMINYDNVLWQIVCYDMIGWDAMIG